jgi:S-adenosyl methyltransferase
VADGERVPPGLDVTKPSIARVYDAFLGGKDNFAADRAVVDLTLQIAPDAATGARANRAFLRRAVRYLVEQAGLRQLIDIGSGLPTRGNVHEVAEELDPATQVLYVDNDPMVRVHGQALLACSPQTVFATADIREPDKILGHPRVAEFLASGRPVGLLLLAILHHLNDNEDPAGIVARLREPLPRGSHIVVSSFRMPGPEHPEDAAKTAAVEKTFNEKLGTGRWRTNEEILAWFGDWELVEPGLVPLPEWRPDGQPPEVRDSTYHGFVGAVARKP